MKKQEVYDNSSFKFTGTDGKTYGYNKDGQPTQIGLQNSVPYNPPTLLSGNSNSNTATFQPQPTLDTGSLGTDRFGTIGSSGYTGVAESHSFNNPYGGIHAMGGGIHGRYVEPKPQKIQPVQTVINTTQPVVKQEVVITKPVLTQKEIQAQTAFNLQSSIMVANAERQAKIIVKAKHDAVIKAEAIVKAKITVVNEIENIKVLTGSSDLKGMSTKQLADTLKFIDYNLDAMLLQNQHIGYPDIIYLMNSIAYPSSGVLHSVIYLNLSNTGSNDTSVNVITEALISGNMSKTKTINLSGNNITDKGANNIAEAMKTGNFKLEQLNLSGNKITDKRANNIAEALKTGKINTLKKFDVSGNDISLVGEKFMIDALRHESTQSVILLLKRTSNLKDMLFGSKEEKQAVIKHTLQEAQDNGVDVKNVAVSKGVFGFLDNLGYVISDFGIGFAKCNTVPEDIETFATEAITAKISKKAVAANTAKDAVVCFFESIEEVSISPEGIQLIKDLDLVGANSLIDSLE